MLHVWKFYYIWVIFGVNVGNHTWSIWDSILGSHLPNPPRHDAVCQLFPQGANVGDAAAAAAALGVHGQDQGADTAS